MIETVLGPIAADQLGPTSMHEHLLADVRGLHAPPREPPPTDPRVRIESLGFLRFNQLGLADNLVLDDPDLAIAELAHAAAAGQRALVDLTVWGFGGPAPELPRIARESGLQIVAGVGAYLGRLRPDWLRALDVDQLTTLLRDALLDRLPGCEHRAGIVGTIATGHPRSAEDDRILAAAGAAAASTGVAVVARVDPRFHDGPAILERLAAEGVPADRVVLSNVDGYVADRDHLRELAASGAVLKWSFGYEAPPRVGMTSATDAERIDALCQLLEEGARQVLACGAWTKTALRRFGGPGYDHLLLRVVPALRDRGVPEDQLDALLVGEPRRLLDRQDPIST
ncbi:resiniferatoxin-binding phosphotriesterase-related protein [Patulibacter medicamentivorans]|uniref:Resiniferatoxin-binding phosphotriesterase-related protein n=1 Tax=Patulibacter medicamentivorans TaxID=1097667 RepID=H0EAE2_9ACTN|nr:resiniferatoxin-binding phosphotriesterase-related protein [Patulibacter medicamentivorans]